MIGNRAVLIVCLALSLAVTGCFSRTVSNKDGVVDVEATAVTKRDLEVARQMGAPERVIESMEQGEWLYVSDREAVRYAELAIDYMQETYGQACHAQWSTVPWVLNQKAEVTLVADGGEHDGSVVTVTVSMSEPHEFADNWTAILRAPQYEKTVMDALNQALVDLPQNSWAARVWPNEDPETTDAVSGSVDVYISPAEVKKKEDLDRVCGDMEKAFGEMGIRVTYYVLVPATEAPGGRMTVEYGKEASLGGSNDVLFRAHGNVGFDAA